MDHRQAADFVARRLRQDHPDLVELVILYGSTARGTATAGSDVDLLVVGKDYRSLHRALLPILGDLMVQGAPLVSTLVLTSEEYSSMRERGDSFYRTVLREGEQLLA